MSGPLVVVAAVKVVVVAGCVCVCVSWGDLFRMKETDASFTYLFPGFQSLFLLLFYFKIGCLFDWSLKAWRACRGTRLPL